MSRVRPRFPSLIEVFWNYYRDPAVVAAQAERQLRRIVRHAYENVPFYREHWRAGGFHPRDFRGRVDLPAIPPVDKDMIVEAGARAFAPRPRSGAIAQMSTSGTSGRSIHVQRHGPEMRVTRRALLRQLVFAGARPWHPFITLASAWLSTRRGFFVQKFCRTHFLSAATTLDEQVAAVLRVRPLGLIGQTGGIYLLARELLRRGERTPLRFVVPTGATLMPEMRQTMIEAFGVAPRDMYGAIELGVVSMQCGAGNYHVDHDRVALEIVDETAAPVPAGARGQVICTALYSYYMPFIRYRLLDIAAVSTRTCDCGCRLPVMEAVQGRVNDFLPTPRGDLVSPHFFFHLFDACGRNPVKDWRLTQETLETLVYEYVPEPHFESAALEQGLNRVRERFGPECRIRVRAVEHLPLSPAGKRNCILSKLRPSAARYDEPWMSAVVASASASADVAMPDVRRAAQPAARERAL